VGLGLELSLKNLIQTWILSDQQKKVLLLRSNNPKKERVEGIVKFQNKQITKNNYYFFFLFYEL
jgi:hypothetical protein